MKAYKYAEDTHEFTFPVECQIDPIESKKQSHDVYLTPSNSTLLPPPNVSTGYARVFNNGTWTLVEDHRGQMMWNISDGHYGNPIEVKEIGDIPAGYSLERPSKTLNEALTEKHAENDQKAEVAREGQSFTVMLESTTLSFITNRKTQQDLQTAMTFLQAGASKYTWIDENGVCFDFSSTGQILQVSEVFMEKANVYATWQHFKAQIDAATTVAEVEAIVIDYGINAQNLSAQILDD